MPKLDAFLMVDYASIEMRMLGVYTAKVGNTQVADEFRAGLDPHMETAKLMFRTETPTKQQRQISKMINFLIVYGGGAAKLQDSLEAEGIKVSYPQARGFLQDFHQARPIIRKLQTRIIDKVEQRGYVVNLYGRRYRDTIDKNYAVLNYLLQGSAADMIKRAVIKTHKELKSRGMKSHIVNIIHDEILLDCARDEIPDVVELVQRNMVDPLVEQWCPVDTEVEVSYTNWGDAEVYIG